MLSKINRDAILNPEERLIGTCATCKGVVEIERWQAAKPVKAPGTWSELPFTECPHCLEEIKKFSDDPRRWHGPRVYLTKKP